MYGLVAPTLLLIPGHSLAVPPGPHLSVILNSPILGSDRGIPDELAATVPGRAPGAAGGTGTPQFEFGVDPTVDPELAMVSFQSKIALPPVPSITQIKRMSSFLLLGPADVDGRGSRTSGGCLLATTTATGCVCTNSRRVNCNGLSSRSWRCVRTGTRRTFG